MSFQLTWRNECFAIYIYIYNTDVEKRIVSSYFFCLPSESVVVTINAPNFCMIPNEEIMDEATKGLVLNWWTDLIWSWQVWSTTSMICSKKLRSDGSSLWKCFTFYGITTCARLPTGPLINQLVTFVFCLLKFVQEMKDIFYDTCLLFDTNFWEVANWLS